MSDGSPLPPDKEFDARLREAKAKRGGRDADGERRGGGLSFALRIGVDLVAALAVGVGIGVLLDRWLGTAPWFLIVFFVLGAAAGMLNVYRVMAGYGYAAGYRRPKRKPERSAGQRDKTPDREQRDR